jgi:outer membrane protein TolC
VQQAAAQLADLEGQFNDLLDYPPCTKVELVEPPFPLLPIKCADEAADLAISVSPEVRMAEQDIAKAHAAVAAAKVDYLPNVVLFGGYAKQTGANYIQQDINFVGFSGSYTFLDWGKRKNTIRQRREFIALAELKVEQTRDEVARRPSSCSARWRKRATPSPLPWTWSRSAPKRTPRPQAWTSSTPRRSSWRPRWTW